MIDASVKNQNVKKITEPGVRITYKKSRKPNNLEYL
jgi:hypothetical protein